MRSEQEWQVLADATIARSKREILRDIAAGVVPMSVQSFADLHDYVDANTYGGMCDGGWLEWNEDDELSDDTYKWANYVQDAVHFWLATHRDDLKEAR